jgi:hypothetical protein
MSFHGPLRRRHLSTRPRQTPANGPGTQAPIDQAAVAGYHSLQAIGGQMSTFIELIRGNARLYAMAPGPMVTGTEIGEWWFPLEARWPLMAALDPDYGAFIAIEPSGATVDGPTGEPGLRAGYYFAARANRSELLTRLADEISKRREPANRTTTILREGFDATCAATLRLADLPPAQTLTEQAHFAAGWATDTFAFFSQIGAP